MNISLGRCFESSGRAPVAAPYQEFRRKDGLLCGVVRRQFVGVEQLRADPVLLPVPAVLPGTIDSTTGVAVGLSRGAATTRRPVGAAAVLSSAAPRLGG